MLLPLTPNLEMIWRETILSIFPQGSLEARLDVGIELVSQRKSFEMFFHYCMLITKLKNSEEFTTKKLRQYLEL